ncbi:protein FAM32A-like [Ctenocephalides felis]|uniref:protein FAM32A-like n=1 Tax=Ctenocephalides felis TaxID=7515 RepID=UPI000E6E3C9B|nr:protein FAM32A-like [Ctenocephalides felis]
MSQSNDEYHHVVKGKLKLKVEKNTSKKKKHKKDKHKKVLEQVTVNTEKTQQDVQPQQQRTKAEISFLKMQEKMQKEKIAQKAAMTHKQRVEKFNQHLDSLTEHFDIPKVSWTK